MARAIVGAKQEQRRARRLAKVVEVLKTGKKWTVNYLGGFKAWLFPCLFDPGLKACSTPLFPRRMGCS